MYEEVCEVIKNARISVGDKLILSNLLFMAERLEKENTILQNRIDRVLDQCAVNWINKTLKGDCENV